MNDDYLRSPGAEPAATPQPENHTLGSSTIYRLCEEVIALRERNRAEHKFFEQSLTKTRDELKASFNKFAADTHEEYQRLRQQVNGEKKVAVALLNELLEVNFDLTHILAARPRPDDAEAVARWIEAIEVESRKVEAALLRHGIQPYEAVIGSAYDPRLHERVGSKHAEGMGPHLVAEQRERGYASAQPDFVLRRPKVIVSE
jgi:molecular chaperone GrpE (heat shock protein)